MNVDKDLILQAKKNMGDKAAIKISDDLDLSGFDNRNFKACCPFHEETTPSFIWNSKDNYFHCFGCGKNYDIVDHYIEHYNLTFLESVERLFKETDYEYNFSEKGIKTKKNHKYPNHIKNDNRDEVEKYLSLRKISKETLDYCDVQQDSSGNIVFHYYDNNDVLGLVKYRPSKKVNKGENKNWCQKDADTLPLLYNMNKIDTTKPLIIVEGEIDAISLIECGIKNVVSVPFGANNESWIEYNWDWLEHFDKVIVWSDNDVSGINLRKNICARLGNYRTFYVDLPLELDGKKTKDANSVLFHFGKETVIKFLDDLKEIPISGIVDMADVEDYDLNTIKGIKLGIKELDSYLYKRIYGTVSIWTGKNSSGKSVFVNQACVIEPLNQGEDVFIFSGELPTPMLKSWLERTMAGTEHIEMVNDTFPKISKETLILMRNWYKGRIWLYDSDDHSATAIMNKMIELKRKKGVSHFIIDNLMVVDLQCSENEKYTKQKDFIKSLINFAKDYNCIVDVVAHPKKTNDIISTELDKDDIAGSGDITNLAHYVFGVHRYSEKQKEGESDKSGKYLKGKEPIIHDTNVKIMKNRITGTQDKKVNLWFDFPSYRFYSNTQELYKRYKWNKDMSPLPTHNPKEVEPEFVERN